MRTRVRLGGILSALVIASVMIAMSCSQSPSATGNGLADLVIFNGRVWTVDPARPSAEAVAVVGERIAAVGANDEIRRWIGRQTRVVDAAGKSVLPGFIDAHAHFATGGFQLSSVDLRDAATPEEFTRRLGEHAKKLRKGEWIQGGTWDHELWGGSPLPTREWIDRVTPDHPVFVSRYDGHMALANSLALKLAGVTRNTTSPAGGEIVNDARGELTGLLKDAAMDLVSRIIPEPTEEQRMRAIRAALAEARRLGLTGIHDISDAPTMRVYQKLLAGGELTARFYCLTPIEQWESPARAGITAGFGNDWIRTGALKGFADGSLGSTTALFFEPYKDAPNTSGLPAAMMFPEGNMLKMALGGDRAGLQLCIHAIGDKANRLILDVFAEVEKQHGRRDRRPRIEHAQHIHPDDFARFARLGVIASMQPYHAIDDGRWAEKRIGHKRCETTYAFRTFLDNKVTLAFGSDWTVAPLDPLQGIYAAVTRRTLDGKNSGGWFPEQRIALAEAIEAYTMGSAYAEFAEKHKGSITPGKLADLVLLDADLFAIPPEKIKDAKVSMTIVGGKVVYAAKK
jgi:hypothetical protein